MLWAAACMFFFWFLRAGEFTVTSALGYNPEIHLNLADLSFDSHTNPTMACIKIKQSKTDPLRQGVEIFLGRAEAQICPVAAILQYLEIRPPGPCPLFIRHTGGPLTRSYLVTKLQGALRAAGLQEALYNGQSFRIGAATSAEKHGMEDSLIQTLGRWRSDAYKSYIKIPRNELANVSRLLAQGRQ